MSVTIKSTLIPDLFRIVARMLDTTSALQLRNTCRQFSDRDKETHSGYTCMIECPENVDVARLPILGSYARCLRPHHIVLSDPNAFTQVPILHELLARVQCITFCYKVVDEIPRGWWPPSTIQVECKLSGSTNWPEKIKTLHCVINSDEYHLHRFQTFPISLTSLVINVPYNDGFYLKHNELLEVPGLNHLVNLTKLDLARNVIHYAPLPSLPPALLKLRTGDLSHPIKRGALPASLKMLNIVGGLKCSIEDGALPDGLTHLRISSMRGHEFMKYHVPRSLRYLQLSVGNEVPVDDFAAFIAALPDSVEVLHISDLMQVVSVSKWPASLRRLHVTTTSITRLLTSGQHEIIRPISKFKFAPFARKFKSLHINNITYERSLHRRTASQSKRHMYRFATGQSRLTLDCFGDATVDVHRLLQ